MLPMARITNFVRREEIIKRSVAYAVTIILLTVLVTALFLYSQDLIAQFISFQTQIIIAAGVVLVLALFIQYRQTTESTANAKLHLELELANDVLAEKNQEISSKQDEIERDLRTALMVQQAIINRYRPSNSEVRIAAKSIPAANVGGDFYEFMQLDDDGRLDIVIGDVAGHGVPSSLVTILSMVLFRELAKEERVPAILLLKANTLIEEYIHNTVVPFVTAFYGSYLPKKQLFRYAKAGHPAPLLKRDGQWVELDARGVFLGAFGDNTYEDCEVEIKKGDIVILYTDGLTETKAPEGHMFGVKRLQNMIDHVNTNDTDEILDAVLEEVAAFSGGVQDDDRTLVALAF